ncbi:hypothetical protein AAFC00_004772 [Neodothiora populina]|uniref:Acetyl-CoA synthetase-like protein n=1 Tax=Neodothiora populina TaxID=2781224 RepID=A0ABR3P3Y8_9PEZI
MPWKSRWTVDIPKLTVPSYVFGSPTAELGTTPLLIDAERSDGYWLSHSTFRLWSQRLALGLQNAGLQKGDRVLLFSGNTLFFPVVFNGVIMAGGIFTGANPTYVARELAYQLQDSGARFLMTSEASLKTSLAAAESIGFPQEQMFVFDSGYDTFDNVGESVGKVQHWSRLLASPDLAAKFAWEDAATEDDLNQTVTLNYSSGTTGVPKGVMITHKNYVSNCAQVLHNGTLMPDHERLRAEARWMCFLPMYHAYGQTYYCVTSAVRNTPTYIMQKFDFIKLLGHIQKYRITDLTMVPPIAVLLAKHPDVKKYDLSSIRSVSSGAAPLGREVSVEVEQLWPAGVMNMKQGWGMTEVTCTACAWDPTQTSTSNAVGELVGNIEGQIVDDITEREVPRGQRGELWIRGPVVMKGYWRKPEATKETLTSDGWLKTGDIAYLDEQGLLFIVDRKKELIKVKGNQVAPAELEALLLEHPSVADAAVVGVTINGEELPRAYLVRQVGADSLSASEIHEFMKSRVARHKRLAGGVAFIASIPKNPSGKILRKDLRELAKKEVGDSEARQSRL